MGIFSTLRKLWRMIKNIPKIIANAINKAIEAMFRKPLAGIMEVIETFRRIMCFFKTIPKRGRNITSGVSNIFLSVEKKWDGIGKSISTGYKSTTTLLAYSGEWAQTRTECIIKFITNLYKCIFFYILKSIGNIIYVLVIIPIKYFGYMLGMNMDNRLKIWGVAFNNIDNIIYSLLGFRVGSFPKSIQEDCFTCVRLKNAAVSKKADELSDTFKIEIPKIMSVAGDYEFGRAKRQFNESSKVIVREPRDVK
jgi:hypothetical protein